MYISIIIKYKWNCNLGLINYLVSTSSLVAKYSKLSPKSSLANSVDQNKNIQTVSNYFWRYILYQRTEKYD